MGLIIRTFMTFIMKTENSVKSTLS